MLTRKSAVDSADKTVTELKMRSISAEVTPGFGDSAYASSPGYEIQQLGVFQGSNPVIARF